MKKLLLIAATAIAALVLSAHALAAAQPKFITDTLAPGGGTTTAPVGSPGFDWSDAGVGALTAVGVVLVLAGAALTAVRRRTVVTS